MTITEVRLVVGRLLGLPITFR